MTVGPRQWPQVYDLTHFLHVARVRKHMDMRKLYAFRAQFSHVRVFSDCFACNSRMSVCFLTVLRAILVCPSVF